MNLTEIPYSLQDAAAPGPLALDAAPAQQRYRVVGITHASAAVAARLAALGVRPGRGIDCLRAAAFGGPLHVRVGSTEFMIRRRDARHILVEPV